MQRAAAHLTFPTNARRLSSARATHDPHPPTPMSTQLNLIKLGSWDTHVTPAKQPTQISNKLMSVVIIKRKYFWCHLLYTWPPTCLLFLLLAQNVVKGAWSWGVQNVHTHMYKVKCKQLRNLTTEK